MEEKKHTPNYPAEFCQNGVRLYREQRDEYPSDKAAFRAIAPNLGCSPDSLRVWCRQTERDAGEREGMTLPCSRI